MQFLSALLAIIGDPTSCSRATTAIVIALAGPERAEATCQKRAILWGPWARSSCARR
jgi:hypothetical protein